MASQADLKTAARCNPALYKKIADLEKKLNFTFIMPRKKEAKRFLEEITGIAA
jgi:hypothetical protein